MASTHPATIGAYRCYHKFDGDGVGASRRGAHPGLRFFVFKGRCSASGILLRETGDVEREAEFADAGL